jgi:hypothetical protein
VCRKLANDISASGEPRPQAAAIGEIPTIRVGGLLRVPIRAMERLLDTAGTRDPDQAA